jgi:hypothetical protein
MHSILRGAISGLVATVPQTIPIIAAQRLNLIQTPPPIQISDRIASIADFLPKRSDPGFTPVWLSAHLGYGAGCGIVYTLVWRFLPRSVPVAGLMFGGAVWGVSYLGFLPALRLYPAPDDDSDPRVGVMILAHAIFGVALASVDRRLGGGR